MYNGVLMNVSNNTPLAMYSWMFHTRVTNQYPRIDFILLQISSENNKKYSIGSIVQQSSILLQSNIFIITLTKV